MLKRLTFLSGEQASPQWSIIDDGPGRDPGPGPLPDTSGDGATWDFSDGPVDSTDTDSDTVVIDSADTDAFSFTPDTSGDDGAVDEDCTDSTPDPGGDSCCSCGEGFLENPIPCGSCSCGGCGGCGGYFE